MHMPLVRTPMRTDGDGPVRDEAPVTPEAYAQGMLMRGIHL